LWAVGKEKKGQKKGLSSTPLITLGRHRSGGGAGRGGEGKSEAVQIWRREGKGKDVGKRSYGPN